MSASNDFLDQSVYAYYESLDLPKGKLQAEYVWIGGNLSTGMDLRCKTKTIAKSEITSLDDLPIWNYDGSSTGQAPGKDSEVYLKPVAYYPDPFRRAPNVIVLCEACLPDGKLTPIPTNTRREAEGYFKQKPETVPWFGIEQEYTLFHADGTTPFGWPKGGFPRAQLQAEENVELERVILYRSDEFGYFPHAVYSRLISNPGPITLRQARKRL